MSAQVIQFPRRRARQVVTAVPIAETVNVGALSGRGSHGLIVRGSNPTLGVRAGDLLIVLATLKPRAGDLVIYEDDEYIVAEYVPPAAHVAFVVKFIIRAARGGDVVKGDET